MFANFQVTFDICFKNVQIFIIKIDNKEVGIIGREDYNIDMLHKLDSFFTLLKKYYVKYTFKNSLMEIDNDEFLDTDFIFDGMDSRLYVNLFYLPYNNEREFVDFVNKYSNQNIQYIQE